MDEPETPIEPKLKYKYVHEEVLDDRGRFISADEFRWLMATFADRYDPRRLCFGLLFTCGLRVEDGINVRITNFDKGFTELKLSQNKPKVIKQKIKCPACKGMGYHSDGSMCQVCYGKQKINSNNGIIRLKTKPRYALIPIWLSDDLRNYVRYRLMLGQYIGNEIERLRLFPKLTDSSMREWINKLRKNPERLKEAPWLSDVWKIVKFYDDQGQLVREMTIHRVNTHAGRAYFCTSAVKISGNDLSKARRLTGHNEVDVLDKYNKVSGIEEAKRELRDKYMENLISGSTAAFLPGQKKITGF